MRLTVLSATAIFSLLCAEFVTLRTPAYAATPGHTRPSVLVELFTSEGCSSCPPADAILAKIDHDPGESVDAIILSEHVDYWNHDGWTDPYSSAAYSERQRAYVERLKLNSSYTPEMVIDGAVEFVGSNEAKAWAALAEAAKAEKTRVKISVGAGNAAELAITLEVDPLPAGRSVKKGDVYLALAENRVSSSVAKGENAGRTLPHVAVTRSLQVVGSMSGSAGFRKVLTVKVPAGLNPSGLRVVAFVQEHGVGRVLGAAMTPAQL